MLVFFISALSTYCSVLLLEEVCISATIFPIPIILSAFEGSSIVSNFISRVYW
ncbi:hypothetical protein L873DRAFT_1886499 [Choiromyces venosus 120613-1]|uniref:Uncharacterized protein n=1 Tax=Choiromyces venosus 120613-1 TaxID=1336337 RepID=A0A3N4JUG1_9PEZI|nr:hypothetical protein L873DRAFT_1886499 [Choiromyces venosus 120613-1]